MTARRRGSVALEFAVTLPVLLLILVGVIEWGWYLSRDVACLQTARDGALAGSLTRQEDDPAATARARAYLALDAAGFPGGTAQVTATELDSGEGLAIRVRVSVAHAPFVPLVPTPDTLRAEVTMRLVDQ